MDLIYKASRDGWLVKDIEEKVKGKSNILSII